MNLAEVSTRLSQKDIARIANVHPTTVSLALRNSPRLPAETKQRIRKLADELGYHPDPLLDALNAYRLAGKQRPFQGVLAWLNCWQASASTIFTQGVFAEAMQRALVQSESNGFQLEEFRLGAGGHTWQRLSSILRERGVQGVIVPPLPGGRAHLRFQWDWFCNVTIGFSLARPELHRVANDAYGNMRRLIRGIRHAGLRRFGLVMLRHEHLRTDTQRLAAYNTVLYGDTHTEIDAVVPTLWADSVEDIDVVPWFRKHRPEAILVQNAQLIADQLIAAGISVPGEVVVASYIAQENPGFPGVVEDNGHLTQVAVEYLVGMIRRGETGLPEKPLRLLVSGTWHPGEGEFALPRRCHPVKRATRTPRKSRPPTPG